MIFLSLVFLFLSFFIVVFKCCFYSSILYSSSNLPMLSLSAVLASVIVEPNFLLAPLYWLPDPGMEVDLRSIFFCGVYWKNCAEGSSGWANAFLV